MPFAAVGGLAAALEPITATWRMAFASVHFILFLPLAAAVYFALPAKPQSRARRVWLLLASYYFYFFAAPKYLVILLAGTLASWLLGLWIAAAAPGKRRLRMAMGVALLGLGLCFFKYNGFFAPFLSPLFAQFGVAYSQKYFSAAYALGISFYTFTAIGYLADTARGDVEPERSLLDYALFLGFFPSVTMGPIARAGGLLPQLKDTTRRFDAQNAAKALLRMGIGFFKKLAVADTLAVFTGVVYGDLQSYSGGTLTLAALAFAFQLYFDFAGYSDIAIGAARLLGVKLPENFHNPYFATNFSGLWSRWHISLSSWLQDYIFTPLVWSRWTDRLPFGKKEKSPPVLSSIAVVFLVSGVWHGDTMCYLVWGALQALFRIGEELLHRTVGKPKKRPSFGVRAAKTAVVFVLWMESLVFFRVGMPGAGGVAGSIADAVSALIRQFSFVGPGQVLSDAFKAVQSGFYNDARIAGLFAAFALVCLALALWADWLQCHRLCGNDLAAGIMAMKPAARWAAYFLLALACFAGFIAASGGFGGSSFLYGGF